MPNLCVKSEILLVECNGSFGVPYNILHYSYENSTVPPMMHVRSLHVTSCMVGLCIATWAHIFLEVKKSRSCSAVILLDTCKELKRSSAGMHLPYVFLAKKLLGKNIYVECLCVCQESVVSEHYTRVFCSASYGNGSGRKRNTTLILTLEVEII